MNLHLAHASLSGTAAQFAGVANDTPHSSLGQICIAVVSHTPSVTGREIFDQLQKNYFLTSNTSPFEALKLNVNKIRDYFLQRDTRIDLAVLVFYRDIAYIAVAGNATVVIHRKERVVPLVSSNKEEVHFLSGHTQAGDSFKLLNSLDLSIENEPGGARTQQVRQRLINVIDALLARLPQTSSRGLKIHDPGEDFKIHKQRKYAVVFGIVLVILLGMSVVIGMKRNEHVQKTKAYQAQLNEIRSALEEARSIADISQDRARSMLLEARDKLISLRQSELADSELEIVATGIDDSLGSIAGLYKHPPELFLDLSLVSSNFSAQSIVAADKAVLVFDSMAKKLVSIDTNTKKTEVVAGPDTLEAVVGVTTYESRIFTLSSDGVTELTKAKTKVIPKDWQGEALISAFAGNMYVVDKSASQIYRYPGTTSGFGQKTNWFASDVITNFSQASSLAIDGSIWVLSGTNKILKFSLGKVDSFFLQTTINSISAIATNEEAEDLYLLDKENGHIIVVDKKGTFRAQYEHDQLKAVTAMVVDVPLGKIFLAAGDKLFTLEIKHL